MKTLRIFMGIAILMALFLLSSCKETEAEKAVRIVKEWSNKEIIFPQSPIFTIYAKDTVDVNYLEPSYKIISYVDSVGCMQCKLQLSAWKKFIADILSTSGKDVPLLLFMHPRNPIDVRNILLNDNYDQPVCIDLQDSINILNHFPDNIAYQTFLLNEENKVVAIGNPMYSDGIKDLYFEQLTGKEFHQISDGLVTPKVTTIDLGKIQEKSSCKFMLRNDSDRPMIIHTIKTSCGCIEAEYEKVPIVMGDSMELHATYTPDNKGFFKKSLSVYHNLSSDPIVLFIQGTSL